ncbi:hypothetical protein [Pseudobdellovibrio sp. HCB154]|uniref:hypothetical protein n=1 Tax=Pseudobdellovibrio sp. HCB154 TaxID=3386277 RepID=UPI003916DE73
MSKKFLQFFLIFSFVVAQIFTQQVHELTHFLSQTDCEPEFVVHHASEDPTTVEFHESHEHCKFLQLLSIRHSAPFITDNTASQAVNLNFNKVISLKVQIWISNSPNSYHQARAPPVA